MLEVLNKSRPAYGKVVLVKNLKTEKIIAWGVVSKIRNDYGWHPIPMIYVHSRCRKQGVAKKILKELLLHFAPIYFGKSQRYNIPRSKRNILYHDNPTSLFGKEIKKQGFHPIKLARDQGVLKYS
jgi:GNAT superfamily N-acetyltransferase